MINHILHQIKQYIYITIFEYQIANIFCVYYLHFLAFRYFNIRNIFFSVPEDPEDVDGMNVQF